MGNSNIKKTEQLGMPHGTAAARLRKQVLFHILKKHGENVCFRCEKIIVSVEELSLEHKIPWMDNDVKLFWDINNIAFSHLSCNVGDARSYHKENGKHPSQQQYKNGCRCQGCRDIEAERRRSQRERGIKT